MPSIFVSYRRDDTEGEASHLFDVLVARYGADSVFLDVAARMTGRNFKNEIEKSVDTCSVLLALIGKNWIDLRNADGERRLDDPKDFVRLETAAALRRDIPVVPVLVRGARMPRPEELPEDLKELAYRDGVELTHARWRSDVDVLLEALDPIVKPKSQKRWWQSRLTISISVALAAVVAVGVYVGVYVNDASNRPDPPLVGNTPSLQTGTASTPGSTAGSGSDQQPATTGAPVQASVPNFAGSWSLYQRTEGGVSHPASQPMLEVITQSGSMVTVDGHTLPITPAGTVSYQECYASDSGTGHLVPTADQADLVDTMTFHIDGSDLVLDTLFDTRHPYSGAPVGRKLVTLRFRR